MLTADLLMGSMLLDMTTACVVAGMEDACSVCTQEGQQVPVCRGPHVRHYRRGPLANVRICLLFDNCCGLTSLAKLQLCMCCIEEAWLELQPTAHFVHPFYYTRGCMMLMFYTQSPCVLLL